MTLTGAVIRERGVNFAVVAVKRRVLDNKLEADGLIRWLEPRFSWIPVVLMAQDSYGTPTYYGRRDIARLLASVPFSAIPWGEYTLN